MVSGGDALVELLAPSRQVWVAELNGRDVSPLFEKKGSGGLLVLLSGLKNGKNVLVVTGRVAAKLQIDNYPLTGSIFSGSQQHRFLYQTAAGHTPL